MAGANGDVLWADNPAQISLAKATASESMKADILLDGDNGHKYKHNKDDTENDFSKVTYNYPPTVERAVRLLDTHKIKFE